MDELPLDYICIIMNAILWNCIVDKVAVKFVELSGYVWLVNEKLVLIVW